ncbi:MAG TPA: hypothetical protein VFZ34_29885 [Blastocatellia bacterium]|nr:hypothetical protein [Blastocatellia bacterium]
MTETYNDNLLRAYLLGSLPGAETESCDELSFTDEAFVARLETVENDLVDAYVQGELSQAERERFEAYYLASPRRQEKVKFARSLQTFAARQNVAVTPVLEAASATATPSSTSTTNSWWQSLRHLFTLPNLTLQWGMAAAALLLLLAGGWLFTEMQRMRGQMDTAQAERAALQRREQELRAQLEQQHTTNTQNVEQLNNELKRTQQQLEQLQQKQELARQQAQGQPPTGETLLAELTPQTRSLGNAATLTIPPRATALVLQLVSPPDDFTSHQVELFSQADSRLLWKSARLKAKQSGDTRRIVVRVPARLLPPGSYAIQLNGIAANGQAEELRKYSFKVVRP